MPFIPVPGTLQANVRFELDGQQIENVLSFIYEGIPFNTAVLAIHTSLESVWWATVQVNMAQALHSVETYYVDLSSESGPVSTQPPFASPTGILNEEFIPNNAAFCVTHRTANRGRSYRGRNYMSGLANSQVLGNYVVSSSAANQVLAFNAMRADLALQDIFFAVVSRYHNNAPRVEGLATAVELSVARDLVLDSQRRRLPSRGR